MSKSARNCKVREKCVGRLLLRVCSSYLYNLSIFVETKCNDSQHMILHKTLNKNKIDIEAATPLLGGD